MTKYPGDHIDFSLNFTAGSNPDYASWADFDEVYIMLFTDSCYTDRHSMNAKTGYSTMTLSEADMVLSGIVLPDNSVSFKEGALQYELKCIGSETVVYSAKGLTGIQIKPFVNKAVE